MGLMDRFWKWRGTHVKTLGRAKADVARGRAILKEIRRSKHEWEAFCKHDKLIERLARRMTRIYQSLEHVRDTDISLPGSAHYSSTIPFEGLKGDVNRGRDQFMKLAEVLQKIHAMMTGKADIFFDEMEECIEKGEQTSRKEALKVKGKWPRMQETNVALQSAPTEVMLYVHSLDSEMALVLQIEELLGAVEKIGVKLKARYKSEIEDMQKKINRDISKKLKTLYRHAVAIARSAKRAKKELQECKKHLVWAVKKIQQEDKIEEDDRLRNWWDQTGKKSTGAI